MTHQTLKVEFKNQSGQTLVGRLEFPVGKARAFALFAHCFACTKDSTAASRICRALTHKDIAVLRFDFTGLGQSQGAPSSFAHNVQDILSASQFLESHYQAPSILFGHSLGGTAILAAAPEIPSVRAVATIAAPSDPDFIQNYSPELSQQDLLNKIKKFKKPLLIFHSPTDKQVSIDHAKTLYEAALHPKSFISLEQADHLLTQKEDSRYVANLISAWSERFIGESEERTTFVDLDHGQAYAKEVDKKFQTYVELGRHRLIADEPEKFGGKDSGPSPYELLLSALGSCTTMTIRMYADHKKWPLEQVECYLHHKKTHAKDCEDCETKSGKIDHIEKHLVIKGDTLSEEQKNRLLEIAGRCPVNKTLLSETKIDTLMKE